MRVMYVYIIIYYYMVKNVTLIRIKTSASASLVYVCVAILSPAPNLVCSLIRSVACTVKSRQSKKMQCPGMLDDCIFENVRKRF